MTGGLALECRAWSTMGRHSVFSTAGFRRLSKNLRGDGVLQEGDLALDAGLSIATEDVVEPERRLGGVRFLPGVPRHVRLALALDETPVVGADPLLAQVGQNRLECAAQAARHVFG